MEELIRQLDAYVDGRINNRFCLPPAGEVTQQLLQSQDFKNLVASAARSAVDMETLCESVSADVSAENLAESSAFARRVAEHVEVDASDIDYSTLADYVDMSCLSGEFDSGAIAQYVDTEEVAGYIDASDVAENLDLHEVASNLDLDEIARGIDYEQLAKALIKVLQPTGVN
jgi:hypothetical protein